MNKLIEKLAAVGFFLGALTSILAVALISLFLFAKGLPAIEKIGLWQFISGTQWSPSDIPPSFGILPMIVGSIAVTIGAALIGVSVGLLTAVFLSYSCPDKMYKKIKPCIELFAGIPSVVYGFFGMALIVPVMGNSILSACLLLGIMILPTVISIAESALQAVPQQYYEGALALGAGHYRSIFKVVMPGAKSGVLAAISLGLGRAIGETIAVIMVAGNQARMPNSLFKGVRTLTANIAIEMGYAADLHREALIATGLILFILIMLINLGFSLLRKGADR